MLMRIIKAGVCIIRLNRRMRWITLFVVRNNPIYYFFLSKLLMNGAVVVAATKTCKGSPPRMI